MRVSVRATVMVSLRVNLRAHNRTQGHTGAQRGQAERGLLLRFGRAVGLGHDEAEKCVRANHECAEGSEPLDGLHLV